MSGTGPDKPSLAWGLVRLARPAQWSKSIFVVVGPVYWLVDHRPEDPWRFGLNVVLAAVAFALASSGCYVFNDLADAEEDRNHPRKMRRPIASGVVPPGVAKVYGLALFAAAAVLVLLIGRTTWIPAALILGLYVANVLAYSAGLKRLVIADVMSLSMGFVLRVLGGCAAIGIAPTTWLLNATLFLSMFLAFGKRLGERRTLGAEAASARSVQGLYSDALLQMAVVVTAVATLLTYAGYVQSRAEDFTVHFSPALEGVAGSGFGLNLLWLTILPSTLALLRAMVQLERGTYDDPTELAVHDGVVRVCGVAFVMLTVLAVAFSVGT
ncbi:MAG: UbiA family prenyltransferase [Phycisphaerales bacterium]|nr:UbiA family prenyltransferase [Planctomycetota bacterium]MCH8508047.1 UbiA family prenyltransferase [Phycisphaerales bacterium]